MLWLMLHAIFFEHLPNSKIIVHLCLSWTSKWILRAETRLWFCKIGYLFVTSR